MALNELGGNIVDGWLEEDSGNLRLRARDKLPRIESSTSVLPDGYEAVLERRFARKQKQGEKKAKYFEKESMWSKKRWIVGTATSVVVVFMLVGLFLDFQLPGFVIKERSTELLRSPSVCVPGDEECILSTDLYSWHLELAQLTQTDGIIDRPYLSEAGARAAQLIEKLMQEAGMSTRVDVVGNVIGRFEASGQNLNPKTLLIGSHMDTVRDGGRYDGAYGVLSAVAVIRVLHERGQTLPFAVEVIAFDDEEGNNRFGTANTGAKAFSGEYLNPAAAEELLNKHDGLEEKLQLRLKRRGVPATKEDILTGLKEAARRTEDVLGFLELHIEQGPVLEREGRPVGVVSAINGQTRMQVRIQGEAGHAGTVPMKLRKDALSAAAEAVTIVERVGSNSEDMVATVGTLTISHASSNVVPGEVLFTIDIRGPRDDIRQNAVVQILSELEILAKRRGVIMDIHKTHEASAVAMDENLTAILKRAVVAEHIESSLDTVIQLPSGAGHDAMIVGRNLPVAMLFTRCAGGISHSPHEFLDQKDATLGAKVLLRAIEIFHE